MVIRNSLQKCVRRLIRYAKAAWLPTILIFIFVLQNAAFNAWCRIVPEPYVRMYVASFGLGVLLYGPALCLKSRWRYAYLVIVSALCASLFTAEYLYYSYSGGFLQISALKLIAETSAITGTIGTLITPRILFFIMSPIVVFIVFLFERYRRYIPISLTFSEKVLTLLLILLTTFGGYSALFAAEKRDWGDSTRLYKQLYDLDSVVGKMGIANYFLEDAVKRVLASNQVSDEDRKFVTEWNSTRPVTSTMGEGFGIAKGRNLIVIQVESLENIVLNQKIGDVEITPHLNELAREGLYFSNYYAQVSMGNTADAEFTTLNSLYPLPDSVAFVDHAQNHYTALPKLLTDHGYHTAVLHGDVPTFWNRANIYPGLGYQTIFSKDAYTITQHIGITGLGDEDFFEQSLTKIETLPQPFMTTLITLSSHTPFILPEDLRTLPIPAGSGLNETQTQYLESVHYADRAIGEFIDRLKQTDLYSNSVIVIFGDHGSYTGISKALGVESGSVAGIDTMQVPLIVLVPGTGLNGERSTPASHIDMYPTIAHLLGIRPPSSVLGQDLLSTKTPVVVQRKNETGGISAIMGSQEIYIASADGAFEHGRCLAEETRQPVSIDECRVLYDEQSAILRVSDTVVRGNLMNELEGKRP